VLLPLAHQTAAPAQLLLLLLLLLLLPHLLTQQLHAKICVTAALHTAPCHQPLQQQ
jgi:hypothetical protein